MGCSQSVEEKENSKKNEEIENQLKKDKLAASKECLGSSSQQATQLFPTSNPLVNPVKLTARRPAPAPFTTPPLGAGESGKSTILKQMKMIHDGGYSNDEREGFKEIIFSNTVQSMRVILEAMERMEIKFSDEANKPHAALIESLPSQI
ncbi:MAG: guanine nucleotide binding protein, alpha subunit, partial [Olpidium bornovanus]